MDYNYCAFNCLYSKLLHLYKYRFYKQHFYLCNERMYYKMER